MLYKKKSNTARKDLQKDFCVCLSFIKIRLQDTLFTVQLPREGKYQGKYLKEHRKPLQELHVPEIASYVRLTRGENL